MCGIVGIVDLQGRRPIDRALLLRMNERQRHRGPDEVGLFVADGIGFGHRRLAIIDLATGQQPLFNEDGSAVVVFNGEIYNYGELIAELTALGHVFRTRSDTEVIVHAWEEWGERCVERFRGMFAFGLWDGKRQTLLLARDRLGVKPLYYAWLADGHLIFASELKALLVHPALACTLDERAIADYFTLGYVPEPRTVFRGARKLSAAHVLRLERGEPPLPPRRYWDLRLTLDRRISAADAAAELWERLRESVRLRLIAEVPLGAFLSGGVDSSAVVAAMAHESSSAVNTCAIAFKDPAFDESAYAAEVAALYRTSHHVDHVDSDDFGLIETLSAVFDEPFADSSAIPTYRVCQLARHHVTVALSGDGGDEMFAGYRRYQTHLREERLRALLPRALRSGLIAPLAHLYPQFARGPRVLRAKAMFQALARDPVAAYLHEVSLLRDAERERLFTAQFRSALGGYSTLDLFRAHAEQARTDDPLALIQYLDVKTYLVDDINTKVDRTSMAHSLETREPLMDHPLVEWAATLPSNLKVRHGQGKYVLKHALRGRVPDAILDRPKMGFAVPLANWFRGPLRARAEQLANSEALLDTGLVARDAMRDLVALHVEGTRDYSAALWALLMFDAFVRRMGHAPRAPESAPESLAGRAPEGVVG